MKKTILLLIFLMIKYYKIHLDTLVANGEVTFILSDENSKEINAHKFIDQIEISLFY